MDIPSNPSDLVALSHLLLFRSVVTLMREVSVWAAQQITHTSLILLCNRIAINLDLALSLRAAISILYKLESKPLTAVSSYNKIADTLSRTKPSDPHNTFSCFLILRILKPCFVFSWSDSFARAYFPRLRRLLTSPCIWLADVRRLILPNYQYTCSWSFYTHGANWKTCCNIAFFPRMFQFSLTRFTIKQHFAAWTVFNSSKK